MSGRGALRQPRARAPKALAADDRGGLVNEIVVFEGLHHEKGEVHAARDVALEDGVAHVPAPHRQALAVAFLEVAATHDGPAGVAGEDALGRLHLVVDVDDPGEASETAGDVDQCLKPPRIDVLAITSDVPAAREHEPRPRLRVVEDRLGRSRRVTVYPPRDEHDEYPVAARDRPPYDLAVVGCTGHYVDPAIELGELADALVAAHGNHLVPPIQRVLDHVPPELPGRADDADPHDTPRLQSTFVRLSPPAQHRRRIPPPNQPKQGRGAVRTDAPAQRPDGWGTASTGHDDRAGGDGGDFLPRVRGALCARRPPAALPIAEEPERRKASTGD